MAIFSNGDSQFKGNQTDSNTTIITQGARIKGSLELTCKLYIDGDLEGEINSQKDVNIGQNGHVKGLIKAQKVIVQGYMEGTVDATRVEIKAAGHVKGEIRSSELIIEAKAIFEGVSILNNGETAKLKLDVSKA